MTAEKLDELEHQLRLQQECDHDPAKFCPICRRPRLTKKEKP